MIRCAFISLLFVAGLAQGNQVCSTVRGATILAQDGKNTFLGEISNSFSSKSIFNEHGTYGSQFGAESIWNEHGTFGSEFNAYSPFNKFTSTPPMIIKNGGVIGYLSTNKNLNAAISPNLLKALCEEQF